MTVFFFREMCHDAVCGFRPEVLYFPLTLHDKAYGHRLYTAGGKGGLYLSPQYGREFKPYNTVEHSSCLLSVYQILVDAAGGFDGLLNGVFGDFVEHNAFGLLFFEVQRIKQMPGNGLSLAVLIGSKPYSFCFFGRGLEFGDDFLLIGRDLVDGCETILYIYAEIFFLEIANMPIAGHDVKVFSEKLLYGLCFCRRLDDYQVFIHSNTLSFL